MNDFHNIVIIINKSINKVFDDTIMPILILDNNSSLLYYYGLNTNEVFILHNLNFLKLNKLVNDLLTENSIIKTMNRFSIESIFFKDYNFSIKFKDLIDISSKLYFNNFYLDIIKLEFCSTYSNKLITCNSSYITFCDNKILMDFNVEYILDLLNMYIISYNSKNYNSNQNYNNEDYVDNFNSEENLYQLNIINNDNKKIFKYLIEYTKHIDENYFLKLKNNFENETINIYKKLLTIIHNLQNINRLELWISLLNNEFNFINRLLFNIEKLNFYDTIIKDKNNYLLFIILNINNVVQFDFLENYFNNDLITDRLSFLTNFDKLDDYKNIKNITKELPNFDRLLVDLDKSSKFRIKNIYHILLVLFYNNQNCNFSIKIAYIFKRFYFLDKQEFEKIFDLFNKIIFNSKNINLDLPNKYFYSMIENKKLVEFENYKFKEIPRIKNNFISNLDNIDIIEYQDSFGLLYEFIYDNNIDFSTLNFDEFIEDTHNSILSNIRSNNLLKNSYRKKKSICKKINNDDINFFLNSSILSNNDKDEELEQINNLEDLLFDFDNINIFNNKSNNRDNYKEKYKKEKNKYNKLKLIEKIFMNKSFDLEILKNNNEHSDELTDDLIDTIIDNFYKFTNNQNMIIENLETDNEDSDISEYSSTDFLD